MEEEKFFVTRSNKVIKVENPGNFYKKFKETLCKGCGSSSIMINSKHPNQYICKKCKKIFDFEK